MRRGNRGDLAGLTFGRNHVIERHHQDAQRHWIYRCEDTYDGSLHLVRDSELVPVERSLYKMARYRSRKEHKPFTITEADIHVPKFCPLLGMQLIPSRGQPSDGSPTLDCIDPARGYVTGNIWVISFLANTVKNCGDAEHHRQIAWGLMDRARGLEHWLAELQAPGAWPD